VAIACGSGTYIRSIARDLGEKLGCGATLSGLRRTYSNGFDLSSSLSFDQIAELVRSHKFTVLAPDHGLHFLPMINFDEEQTTGWRMGRAIAIPDDFAALCEKNIYVRTYDHEQKFLGVSEIIESCLQPVVGLYPIN
jgi:tRNA pseudouridine55 synthase